MTHVRLISRDGLWDVNTRSFGVLGWQSIQAAGLPAGTSTTGLSRPEAERIAAHFDKWIGEQEAGAKERRRKAK